MEKFSRSENQIAINPQNINYNTTPAHTQNPPSDQRQRPQTKKLTKAKNKNGEKARKSVEK